MFHKTVSQASLTLIKNAAILILLTTLLFNFAAAQSTASLHGFIPNAGQMLDAHGSPNTAVAYLLPLGNGLNVQLRANGFSYDAYRQMPDGGIHFHRVDIDFEGRFPSPLLLPSSKLPPLSIILHRELLVYSAIGGWFIPMSIPILMWFSLLRSTRGKPLLNTILSSILMPRPSDIQLRYRGLTAVSIITPLPCLCRSGNLQKKCRAATLQRVAKNLRCLFKHSHKRAIAYYLVSIRQISIQLRRSSSTPFHIWISHLSGWQRK
ncbi:MAG: hypothetical protein R2795_14735 [Saprospiraceae bacterium]